MIYYLYKITNNINNKFYIGVHQSRDINDYYFGSGKALIRDINKYGKACFTKEILEYFDSKEEMLYREAEIVDADFCLRSDTYNLMPGGGYGSKEKNNLTFQNKRHTDETKAILRLKATNRKASDETRKKMIANNFARKNPELQREHARKAASGNKTEEHKEKIRQSLLQRNKESPSFGGRRNRGLKRQKIKCPYCLKEGAKNTMARFHFNNCKYKT